MKRRIVTEKSPLERATDCHVQPNKHWTGNASVEIEIATYVIRAGATYAGSISNRTTNRYATGCEYELKRDIVTLNFWLDASKASLLQVLQIRFVLWWSDRS